jgi:glycosyltransferase involved in cell wall biosynthesis
MEFIPWALLLKILGWKVIYDVHEDNLLGIMQKEYLPKPARKILYYFVFMLEGLAKKCFVIIIAEKCYKKRFPESVMILNYPLITDKVNKNYTESDSGDEFNLIYTGCISTDRGAFLVLDLLKLIPEVKLTMVGRCAKKLREEMEEYAGDAGKRLELLTDETFVPFDTIKHFYTSRAWAAGLAVFPQTPHYYEKELTKFYEYMIYGIPVIASNFPVWEKLIVGNNAGIVVDPADKELDKAAILKFLNDKELRRKISDSGYSTVYEKFNWLGEEQKLFSVYSEIQ